MRFLDPARRQLLNDDRRLDKDDFLGRNFFLSGRLRGCIGRSLFAGDSAGQLRVEAVLRRLFGGGAGFERSWRRFQRCPDA